MKVLLTDILKMKSWILIQPLAPTEGLFTTVVRTLYMNDVGISVYASVLILDDGKCFHDLI